MLAMYPAQLISLDFIILLTCGEVNYNTPPMSQNLNFDRQSKVFERQPAAISVCVTHICRPACCRETSSDCSQPW